MDLHYRLLNVFAIEGMPFSGNPLCVFERAFAEAPGLAADEMLGWARQFNLSESSFVLGLAPADRRAEVRFFTPSHEMPFAGHPSLGTAEVVAGLLDGPADEVTLSLPAGDVPVRRTEEGWQLRAKEPRRRAVDFTRVELAAALGLDPDAVVEGGMEWVDTGFEQLVVWLTDVEVVRSCVPSATLMHEFLQGSGAGLHVYVWAWTGDAPDGSSDPTAQVEARLFAATGSGLDEDPATGSACANLGGWLVGQGMRGLEVQVAQGAAVGRPSRLHLSIDPSGTIRVGGRVHEVGSGVVRMGRS